jgi:NADH dehydrogenase [ubiquinone] 1 alpha subcomplex assembly factor 1
MKTKRDVLTLIGLATLLMTVASARAGELVLYDFAEDKGGWSVEDDGVMGGLSKGNFEVNEDGHGVFSGDVSLDNDGGFSSVQYYFDPVDVLAYQTVCLRLKGDGKNYRFLVEAEKRARHYYETGFATSGEWETVEIPLADLVPVRRGDRLDLPNFPGETLAQIRLMIANARAESFRLEIERIWLK